MQKEKEQKFFKDLSNLIVEACGLRGVIIEPEGVQNTMKDHNIFIVHHSPIHKSLSVEGETAATWDEIGLDIRNVIFPKKRGTA